MVNPVVQAQDVPVDKSPMQDTPPLAGASANARVRPKQARTCTSIIVTVNARDRTG